LDTHGLTQATNILLSPIYFFLSAGHVLLVTQEKGSDLDRVGSVPLFRVSFGMKIYTPSHKYVSISA